MKILIIKLGSIGDLVHTLTVVSDLKANVENLEIDWLVDESLAEIPLLHKNVDHVYTIPLRKKKLWQCIKTIQTIRKNKYDYIIDLQGLIKSALIARFMRSKYYVGYHRSCIKEPIASLFYNDKRYVNREHAVDKMRSLCAQLFKYSIDNKFPIYNIEKNNLKIDNHNFNVKLPTEYIFLAYGTTWLTKHWPEQYWLKLIAMLQKQNINVVLTCANKRQEQFIVKAEEYSNVTVVPYISITKAAALIYNAKSIVAVDTGFAHLADGLNKKIIGLYGPTNTTKVGLLGSNAINVTANFDCAPCNSKICNYKVQYKVSPACFASITPEYIMKLLSSASFN